MGERHNPFIFLFSVKCKYIFSYISNLFILKISKA